MPVSRQTCTQSLVRAGSTRSTFLCILIPSILKQCYKIDTMITSTKQIRRRTRRDIIFPGGLRPGPSPEGELEGTRLWTKEGPWDRPSDRVDEPFGGLTHTGVTEELHPGLRHLSVFLFCISCLFPFSPT